MDKQQLIEKCRYYKGESDNPFEGKSQNKALCWLYESKWVEMSLDTVGNELLADYVSDYNTAGLYDFEKKDGTPKTLKALLLNRYYQSDGSIPFNPVPFKVWYKEHYIEQS